MPVISNRLTSQDPIINGLTGTQVIKFIDAQRVYVKTPDSLSVAPVANYATKSNGVTPTGWTDLGIVTGKPKVNYSKKTKDVKTGIDNIFRSQYVSEKTAQMQFDLGQFDDVALTNVSGLTPSVISSGSIVSFRVGSEDVVTVALLLIAQNKLDGKEVQFYNPAAYINFEYSDNGDELVLKCTATLPFFSTVLNGSSMYIYQSIFA